MVRPRVLATTGLVVLLAGCGNSRAPVPSLDRPARPQGFHVLTFPSAGLTLAAPSGWRLIRGRRPLLAVIASGDAVVALWRYPRRQPPPGAAAALGQARDRLVAAVRRRRPRPTLIRSALVRIDLRPAVELDALERIAGHLRRVRSTHVYLPQSEIVLEQYAPPNDFAAVDHEVFSPLRRSILIGP